MNKSSLYINCRNYLSNMPIYLKRDKSKTIEQNAHMIAQIMLDMERNILIRDCQYPIREIDEKKCDITTPNDKFCSYKTKWADYEFTFSEGYLCLIGEANNRKIIEQITNYMNANQSKDLIETSFWDYEASNGAESYKSEHYVSLTQKMPETRICMYSKRNAKKNQHKEIYKCRFLWIICGGDDFYLRGHGEFAQQNQLKTLNTIIVDFDDIINWPTHVKSLECPGVFELSKNINLVTRDNILISKNLGIGIEIQRIVNANYDFTEIDMECPFTKINKYATYQETKEEIVFSKFKKYSKFAKMWNIVMGNTQHKQKKAVDDELVNDYCINCWNYLYDYCFIFVPKGKNVKFPVCSCCMYNKDIFKDVIDIIDNKKNNESDTKCDYYYVHTGITVESVIKNRILTQNLTDKEKKYWELITILDQNIHDINISDNNKYKESHMIVINAANGDRYLGLGTKPSLQLISEHQTDNMFIYRVYDYLKPPYNVANAVQMEAEYMSDSDE